MENLKWEPAKGSVDMKSFVLGDEPEALHVITLFSGEGLYLVVNEDPWSTKTEWLKKEEIEAHYGIEL